MYLWKITIYFASHDTGAANRSTLEQRIAADTPTLAIITATEGLNMAMRQRVSCISANRMGALTND